MNRLLILDIDGTLLQSIALQMMCLEQALLGIFGSRLSIFWGKREAQATTDSGILAEIAHEILGRAPSAEEASRFKSLFLAELKQALDRGGEVQATPGADQALSLFRRENVAVAVATGGFEIITRVKVNRAGLSMDGIPGAFAEDGSTKEEVLLVSRLRAESHYSMGFDEVVYVGDASYDVRAARILGFRFIGVGQGTRIERLMGCGAKTTIPDLTHLRHVLGMETGDDEQSRKRS